MRQLVILRRLEHAQAGDRIVARQDHDLDFARGRRVECQQLSTELERSALCRGPVQPRELQLLVAARVGLIEDRVLFFEVEQRAGRQRDDELVVQIGRHSRILRCRGDAEVVKS